MLASTIKSCVIKAMCDVFWRPTDIVRLGTGMSAAPIAAMNCGEYPKTAAGCKIIVTQAHSIINTRHTIDLLFKKLTTVRSL